MVRFRHKVALKSVELFCNFSSHNSRLKSPSSRRFYLVIDLKDIYESKVLLLVHKQVLPSYQHLLVQAQSKVSPGSMVSLL